jgi:uncharacterized protein YbjT (DUF2867 family)
MILVTGATGKVGKEIVLQLKERSVGVRAFVRDEERARRIFGEHVELVVGDLEDADSVRRALEGVDGLFLLTPADLRQDELQGRLIDIARLSGVEHVVKLSALGSSPTAPIHLARLHWATERRLAAAGMEYTILRPNMFMQNLLEFADAMAHHDVLFAPLGDGKVAMVDTRDVAAVAAAVLTQDGHDGKTYNITGPEPVSFHDVATELGAALDRKLKYVPITLEQARESMVERGMPEWFADDMRELNRALAMGAARFVSPAVREVAGIEGTTLAEFARDHAPLLHAAA